MHTKFFLCLTIFLGVSVPFFVLADSNNITALVFTTNPQTVAPNTLSAALTVGTVNVSNASEKVSETNDVTFTSTSQTGQFLNVSGQPVSTTMSTNTGTRTFYYQDSTPGTFTLTVTIKGRTSGKQFSANQQIIVGTPSNNNPDNSSDSSDNSNSTSTDDSNATTTNDSSDTSSNSEDEESYAYSSPVEAYIGPEQEPFQISIGRDRVTTVGTPLSFEAKLIPDTGDYNGMMYLWSFGDGTSWDGASPTHTYLYPGDYVVVLNTSRYGNEAVSEAHVKVLLPQVSISADKNCVTIANQSDYELNVGGWAVVAGPIRFVLPKDTLIGAHSETHISRATMQNENVSGAMTLFDPSSDQVAVTGTDTSLAVAASASAQTSIGTDATDTMIVLPDGMSMDDFSAKFKQEYSLAIAREDSQSANAAAGRRDQPLLATSTAVASANTPAAIATSSEAASVIYSIPHNSGGGIFSGVGLWLGHLFGK